MTKQFKIYSDKPMTLKERMVFWNRNKIEKRTVLEVICERVTFLSSKKPEEIANQVPKEEVE